MAGNLTFLIILLLVIAALTNEPALFMPMLLLAGALTLGKVWGNRALKSVRVRRTMSDRAFTNDKVHVSVDVENTGRLPVVWQRLHDSLPAELAPHQFDHAISLKGHERLHFEYVIQTPRRGFYQIGPLTLQSGDVLGLSTTIAVRAVEVMPLLVYPRIVTFERLYVPSNMPLGEVRQRQPLFEDPSRVRGKRDYAQGDSLRRVDWKATAAVGRLQVKMLESSVSLATMVFLDLNLDIYDRTTQLDSIELAIVIAASVANHMITLGQPVGLVINGQAREGAHALRIAPRKGRTHLMHMLEALASVKPVESMPIETFINAERGRLAWGTTLVVITGSADDALFAMLNHARRSGWNPVLVLCGRGVNIAPARRYAATFNIPLCCVRTEDDARLLSFDT